MTCKITGVVFKYQWNIDDWSQSDRLSCAFQTSRWPIGFPSPADSDQCGAKCCPPKRKAVIADHTFSLTYAGHPEYYASQYNTQQQEHTRYVIFFLSTCQPRPCSTGKQFTKLTPCLGKLHKCCITIKGFSKREQERPIWHLIFLSVNEEHKYHYVSFTLLQFEMEQNIES